MSSVVCGGADKVEVDKASDKFLSEIKSFFDGRMLPNSQQKSIINKMEALRYGSKKLRINTVFELCEHLGLEVSIKERCSLYSSWVDSFGYVVLERSYSPYCRLIFNPEDLEDFKMIVGLDSVQFKYKVLIKLWRALHLHYYKVKVPNAVFYRIKKKLKSSVDGLSDEVVNVYGREGEFRGKR